MSWTRNSILLIAGIASSAWAGVPGRGSFERELAVSGPVQLEILSEIGGVTVTAGRSDRVRVYAVLTPQLGPLDLARAEGRIRKLESNPPIEQVGNRIRIGYPADKDQLTRISMRLEIQTPRATEVRAQTGSGGIQVSGLEGAVYGESSAGRIQIANIQGAVTARTRSGSVFVEECQGPIEVHNQSGSADVLSALGPIEATSSSGAIRLKQHKPAAIRAKSRSGAVDVQLASGAGYDYLARSQKGKINFAEVQDAKAKNKRELVGSISGGGPLVDVSTHSSSISIKRL